MKRLFFPALLSVVLLSSCSKNEVTEVISGDTNLIGVNVASGITKGVDTTTASLESSERVTLYAYGTADGSNNTSNATTLSFTYSSNALTWSQTDVQWGDYTLSSDNGLTFYSMHDGSAPKTLTYTNHEGASLSSFTQDASSDKHVDLIYHSSTINAQPVSGNVSAYHTHALSKVDIFANTGDFKAYIASVRLVNVDNEATATISPSTTSSCGAVAWSGNDDVQTASYSYYADAYAATSTSSGNPFSAGSGSAPIIAASNTTPSIMMIPQTLSIVVVQDPDAQIPDASGGDVEVLPSTAVDSYIEVIYILTNSDNSATGIGYLKAEDHPNYADFGGSISEDTPLYVKAAFPFTDAIAFEANNSYSLSLGLGASGSTGGNNLTDGEFVDEDGVTIDTGDATTNLPGEGEQFIASGDSNIGIIITTSAWSVADPETMY